MKLIEALKNQLLKKLIEKVITAINDRRKQVGKLIEKVGDTYNTILII